MTAVIDVTGQRFGRLQVLSRSTGQHCGVYWICRCACGEICTIRSSHLREGKIQSCGCLHREISRDIVVKFAAPARISHGDCRGGRPTPEYEAWRSMLYRCHNHAAGSYKNYGGRGISVCDEWRNSFEAFLAHIGRRPSPQHSIDRIDNDGNYEPGNVRWATAQQQYFNRRPRTAAEEAAIHRKAWNTRRQKMSDAT